MSGLISGSETNLPTCIIFITAHRNRNRHYMPHPCVGCGRKTRDEADLLDIVTR
jgi:hypothetical protein